MIEIFLKEGRIELAEANEIMRGIREYEVVDITDKLKFYMRIENGNHGYISVTLSSGGLEYSEQISRTEITLGLIEFKIGGFTLEYTEDE